jgi:hypothetical protein
LYSANRCFVDRLGFQTLGGRPPIWLDGVIGHRSCTMETAIRVAAKYLKFWPVCSAVLLREARML